MKVNSVSATCYGPVNDVRRAVHEFPGRQKRELRVFKISWATGHFVMKRLAIAKAIR